MNYSPQDVQEIQRDVSLWLKDLGYEVEQNVFIISSGKNVDILATPGNDSRDSRKIAVFCKKILNAEQIDAASREIYVCRSSYPNARFVIAGMSGRFDGLTEREQGAADHAREQALQQSQIESWELDKAPDFQQWCKSPRPSPVSSYPSRHEGGCSPLTGCVVPLLLFFAFLWIVDSDRKCTYVVQQGESMFSIAKNNKLALETLLRLNPEVQPETMKKGDVLNLCSSQ